MQGRDLTDELPTRVAFQFIAFLSTKLKYPACGYFAVSCRYSLSPE